MRKRILIGAGGGAPGGAFRLHRREGSAGLRPSSRPTNSRSMRMRRSACRRTTTCARRRRARRARRKAPRATRPRAPCSATTLRHDGRARAHVGRTGRAGHRRRGGAAAERRRHRHRSRHPQTISQETAALDEQNSTFVDSLIFWQKPDRRDRRRSASRAAAHRKRTRRSASRSPKATRRPSSARSAACSKASSDRTPIWRIGGRRFGSSAGLVASGVVTGRRSEPMTVLRRAFACMVLAALCFAGAGAAAGRGQDVLAGDLHSRQRPAGRRGGEPPRARGDAYGLVQGGPPTRCRARPASPISSSI